MKEKFEGFKLSRYQYLKETDWANPVILKDGDEVKIVQVDKGVLYQNYPVLLSDGTRCSINGKNPENIKLMINYDMKPPILDGRIVYDKTFALRFLHFLERTEVNDWWGEEELEYLKIVARDLLDWQILTATELEEISYLERNGLKKRDL